MNGGNATPDRREKSRRQDLDGLRLLALGRIPRCGNCARFAVLAEAHERGTAIRGELPDVPENCTHQVCTPLIVRYETGPAELALMEEEILHRRAS